MSHYSNKKLYLLAGLFWIVQVSMAQLSSLHEQQMWIKADDTFEYGDYVNALRIYAHLNEIDTANEEINYKIGVCNYNIRKLRKNAIPYFMKVSAAHFPETDYYMGRLSLINKQYDQAITYFTQYKNNKEEHEHTAKEINDLIEKCHNAVWFEKNKNDSVRIINLGNTINTMYSEYAPLIAEKEDFLLFTSRRKNEAHTKKDPLGEYFEDIYISRRNGDDWGVPEVLTDTLINTPHIFWS